MRRLLKAASACAILAALLALASCQQVFTFPLAKGLARDPRLDPDMGFEDTLDVAEVVIDEGDQELAPVVLDMLLEDIDSGTLSAAEEEAAIAAAAEVAIVDSGVSAAVSEILALVPENPDDLTPELEEAILDIILGVDLSDEDMAAFALLAANPGVADDGVVFVAAMAVLMDAAQDGGTPDPAAVALYDDLMTGITDLPDYAEGLVAVLESGSGV